VSKIVKLIYMGNVLEEHNYMKMKQHITPDTTYSYKIYQSIINI